jgi:hypothetical protein
MDPTTRNRLEVLAEANYQPFQQVEAAGSDLEVGPLQLVGQVCRVVKDYSFYKKYNGLELSLPVLTTINTAKSIHLDEKLARSIVRGG